MSMKKILCFLLAAMMLCCAAACGDTDSSGKKERKRASEGQDTTTGTSSSSDEVTLDTGLLSALDATYAKSNKAGLVYDPNVFIELTENTADKVKIACAGDSITCGSDTSSYPAQLASLLKKRFGDRFEVTNYGYSGAYIADFERSNADTMRYCNTDEYLQLRKDNPDVVILMLGTNDIGYITDSASCEELKSAYAELIKDIASIESSPLVFVCTPLVRTTSYSSYLALDALCSTVKAAAAEGGAYVIDTYNITKEYFSSALYETDGLNPNDAGYAYLAGVIKDAVADGLTAYSEGAKTATNYVVYVDSTKGSYESVGASADAPTSSFARAVELCQGGGTIVVSGPVTPATTGNNGVKVFISPENYGKITVTSIAPDGTDYRSANNARIYMSASMYLNGDFVFDNVTFDSVASSTKIVCNFNDITFGSGVSCTVSDGDYSVLIYGHDVVSGWQTEDALSCKESCNLTVDGGTFTYLRAGNYRAYSANQSKFAYGTVKSGVTVNIVINGGTFSREDGSNYSSASGSLSSAIGQNGLESGAAVNLTVNGGKFKGSLFAVPRMNPYPSYGAPKIAGSISITVNGGVFGGKGIAYLQTYSGSQNPAVTGSYSLAINGGSFTGSSKKVLSADGCANSKLSLAPDCAYLANWATVSGFSSVAY